MSRVEDSIVMDYLDGVSIAQIAASHNMIDRSVKKVVQSAGVYKSPEQKRKERDDLIIKLAKTGKKAYTISKELKVAENTVYNVLKSNNLIEARVSRKEEVLELLFIKKLKPVEVIKKTGCSSSFVYELYNNSEYTYKEDNLKKRDTIFIDNKMSTDMILYALDAFSVANPDWTINIGHCISDITKSDGYRITTIKQKSFYSGVKRLLATIVTNKHLFNLSCWEF